MRNRSRGKVVGSCLMFCDLVLILWVSAATRKQPKFGKPQSLRRERVGPGTKAHGGWPTSETWA